MAFKKIVAHEKSLRNEMQLPHSVWNINCIEMEEHFCSCCLDMELYDTTL